MEFVHFPNFYSALGFSTMVSESCSYFMQIMALLQPFFVQAKVLQDQGQ